MNIKDSDFWIQLKRLVSTDDHVEVPSSSVEDAFAIFQPPQGDAVRVNVFRLRPAFTGMVRRAEPSAKLFFELDHEHIVQLEKNRADEGYNLLGFAHGFDEIPVVLYGQECVFETRIEEGGFEFKSLSSGKYSMSFSHEGEEYWIKDLELGTG